MLVCGNLAQLLISKITAIATNREFLGIAVVIIRSRGFYSVVWTETVSANYVKPAGLPSPARTAIIMARDVALWY
jgi:hypothetical protein